MAELGDRVIYTVQTRQRAETVKGGVKFKGSVLHHEFDRFAGIVAGKADPAPGSEEPRFHLALFIPGKPAFPIIAGEGKGDGEFRVLKS